MDPETQRQILRIKGPIVVVEDDRRTCAATVRSLFRVGLAMAGVVHAEPYTAALEGIQMATAPTPPAVVVVDGLEGYGRRVVEACQAEGVPVVAYTGSPALFDGLDVPVVVKPDAAALVAAVRAVLNLTETT